MNSLSPLSGRILPNYGELTSNFHEMVNNGNTHLISIGANPINLDTHIAVE